MAHVTKWRSVHELYLFHEQDIFFLLRTKLCFYLIFFYHYLLILETLLLYDLNFYYPPKILFIVISTQYLYAWWWPRNNTSRPIEGLPSLEINKNRRVWKFFARSSMGWVYIGRTNAVRYAMVWFIVRHVTKNRLQRLTHAIESYFIWHNGFRELYTI